MGVEFPLDEDTLEAMIMDLRPPPELEDLHFCYQRSPWLEPRNGIFLENYYA